MPHLDRGGGATVAARSAMDIVLAERQVETPGHRELRRRGSSDNARDPVIAETGGAAKHERIARLERPRLDRISPFETAEKKSRRITDRNRHHGQSGRE